MARLPRWLVSSPHRRPLTPAAGTPRPHGLHHARTVGDARTACGLYAMGWPFFWDLAFDHASEVSCPDCVAAVRDRVAPCGGTDEDRT